MILANAGLTSVGTVGVTLAGKQGRPGNCFSVPACTLCPGFGALKHPRMAFPGRVCPYVIPENEEIPQTALNNVHQANGNEDERAVSKLQRRHSDVKVYKEFCDFYAKL